MQNFAILKPFWVDREKLSNKRYSDVINFSSSIQSVWILLFAPRLAAIVL